VVLHRALTGSGVWDGPTPWALMGEQRNLPPAPPGPKGLSRLIQQLLHPDPSKRPPDADALLRALQKLRKNPNRKVRVAGRWLAPVRPRRGWLIHGTDPGTGGPSIVATDMSKKRAKRLAAHLQEQGWSVDIAKEALGGRDLLWAGAFALVGSFLVPVIGTLLGLLVGLKWRSSRCRPQLREALPTVSAPLPPRELGWGTEYAVAAGSLLLVAAILLNYWPVMALVPLFLVALVAWMAWRGRPRDITSEALRGRVETLAAEVRGAIERSCNSLDESLALQGELEALELDFRSGSATGDQVLLRLESLHGRAAADGHNGESEAGRTLEALRRSRADIGVSRT
jgi:hypothetical protein